MWLSSYLKSSIGKKTVMAITGLILSGFLIGHLSGNLLLYWGSDAFNTYAHNIKANAILLWLVRGVLLVSFPAHIFCGILLKIQNRAARPIGYAHTATVQASFASRYMIWTGTMLLAFILFHIAHYTLFLVTPEFAALKDNLGRPDAYRMAIMGFQNVPTSIFYILAMICLGLHLQHGLSSLFQSLGLNHNKYNCAIRNLGPILAYTLIAGFISLPVSVLLGVIHL